MCDLPFRRGDACYATVLEHDGDLDEEDCEVKDGVIHICQLGNLVLLVNRMLNPREQTSTDLMKIAKFFVGAVIYVFPQASRDF